MMRLGITRRALGMAAGGAAVSYAGQPGFASRAETAVGQRPGAEVNGRIRADYLLEFLIYS